MKKVLFIGPVPPPVHGHSQMCKYILDSKKINSLFDIDVVNLHTSRNMNEMGKKPLLKVCRFLKSLLRTFYLLISNHYDFVYIAITCHGGGFLKDMPFVLLSKLFRKKIVLHQHNQGVRYDQDKIPFKWLYPIVYKDALVILLSWNLYDDISRYVKKENVLICPNGIPDNSKVEDSIEKEGKTKFLFLSNLLVEKGVYVLLEALRILHVKNIDFECDFVGAETFEIKESDLMQKIAEYNLEKNVRYHGAKYGDEKEQYWKNADVFVLPTLNECYPLVLLEAMQHGIACVASDEGAISDIIDNNKTGLIFSKGDSHALASHLVFLIYNKEICMDMGRESMHKFKSVMTINDFENNILECFHHALKI